MKELRTLVFLGAICVLVIGFIFAFKKINQMNLKPIDIGEISFGGLNTKVWAIGNCYVLSSRNDEIKVPSFYIVCDK